MARIELASGVTAELRPVLPADAPLLAEGLSSMSEESRFARFGIGTDHLTHQELRYLTDVDLVRHVAWGALIDNEAAGIGRYVMLDDRLCAEVAVTVVDRFQRMGLGRALFRALTAVARHDGIETFCFEVAPSNEAVKRILDGISTSIGPSGLMAGTLEIADLPSDRHDGELVELLESYRSLQ